MITLPLFLLFLIAMGSAVKYAIEDETVQRLTGCALKRGPHIAEFHLFGAAISK
jgi:hypothetical protein